MSEQGNNPRRITCITCIDAVAFNDVVTTSTSTGVRCVPFHDFLIMIKLAVGGTPTDIVFSVEFSEDNVTFYKYMNGPFGDLRYEDAAGAKSESVSGRCLGKYIRVSATATGTSEQNTFTVTVLLMIAK